MKLSEIIQKIDTKEETYFGEDLQEEMGFDWPVDLYEHGFTCRPIKEWNCSDTLVGWNIIYHHGKAICLSYQPYRKSDVKFYWISKEIYSETYDFIHSLHKEDDPEIIDLTEEWDNYYKLKSTGQMFRGAHDTAIFNEKEVKVCWDTTIREKDNDYISTKVGIIVDNEVKVVPIYELSFPLKLKKENEYIM